MPPETTQLCAQREHFGVSCTMRAPCFLTCCIPTYHGIALSLVKLEVRSPTPIDTSGSMHAAGISAETMCARSEEMVSVLPEVLADVSETLKSGREHWPSSRAIGTSAQIICRHLLAMEYSEEGRSLIKTVDWLLSRQMFFCATRPSICAHLCVGDIDSSICLVLGYNPNRNVPDFFVGDT